MEVDSMDLLQGRHCPTNTRPKGVKMTEHWQQWDQVRRELWPDAEHGTFYSHQGANKVASYYGPFDKWVTALEGTSPND